MCDIGSDYFEALKATETQAAAIIYSLVKKAIIDNDPTVKRVIIPHRRMKTKIKLLARLWSTIISAKVLFGRIPTEHMT